MTVGRLPSIDGGIQPTIVDAKGDLITAVAADTPARLAVGANDTVLTADSSTATGLKWASAGGSGASFSLINTTTFAGAASYTISSLGAYNQLYITFDSVRSSASSLPIYRFNGDTGSNYAYYVGDMYTNGNTFSTANIYYSSNPYGSDNQIYIGSQGSVTTQGFTGYIQFSGLKSTGPKVGNQFFAWDGGTHSSYNGSALYLGTSAVTSFTISSNALNSGTMKIYGSAV
jgi:hypothetical protein